MCENGLKVILDHENVEGFKEVKANIWSTKILKENLYVLLQDHADLTRFEVDFSKKSSMI